MQITRSQRKEAYQVNAVVTPSGNIDLIYYQRLGRRLRSDAFNKMISNLISRLRNNIRFHKTEKKAPG